MAIFDKRHEFIISKVSQVTQLNGSLVEEIISTQENLSIINQFFKAGGPSSMFCYFNKKNTEDDEDYDFDDSLTVKSGHSTFTTFTSQTGNTTLSHNSTPMDNTDNTSVILSGRVRTSDSSRPVLSLTTDASKYPIKDGVCIYFVKKNPKSSITMKSVEELLYGAIHGDVGILEELKTHLEDLIIPNLKSIKSWGELSKESAVDSKREIEDFLESTDKFESIVAGAIHSLHDTVLLKEVSKRVQIEHKPKSYQKAAQKPEVVSTFEDTVKEWCKQVEILLGEVTAIREESDDSGPSAELDYWKTRMSKFNSITDQLKSRRCKMVLSVLKYARSPLLLNWKALDMKITDAANEAKDNVKYLYILEKFSEPLYKSDPSQMTGALPGLINAIKMMHRKYITRDGILWEQSKEELIDKFRACIDLNESYQHCYRKTKVELQQNPYGKQFDFSESAIFGKFDQFCWRMQKLIDLFTTINQFSSLAESTIEGIDSIIKKFETILNNFRRKKYDFLDHRNEMFDNDYVEFNYNITELESQLVVFINNAFGNSTSTKHSLDLLSQFRSALKQDNLQKLLDEKHKIVFSNFGRDVENMKTLYEKYKGQAVIPRNAPKVAGNIAWARQIWRKLEIPMSEFQKTPSILKTKDAKRIIKLYNKLLMALFKFEAMYFNEWKIAIESAKDGLSATLLVKHPASDKLYVNFDTQLLMLMREVRWLERMGFAIPETAKSVYNQEEKLKHFVENLKHMLKEYYRVTSLPDVSYSPLLKPRVDKLSSLVEQGLTSLTWMSLTIDSFIENVFSSLKEIEEIVIKANDIITYRLEYNCNAIEKTPLILFTSDVRTIQQFLKDQEDFTKIVTSEIDIKNREIESATGDLIEIVTASYDSDEMRHVENEIKAIWHNYETKVFEAVVNTLRTSVHLLKDRISGQEQDRDPRKQKLSREKPIFSAQLALNIPNIVLKPSLEELQKCVNRTARIMLESTKSIYKWNKTKNTTDTESIYQKIGENRTTIKGFLQLTGAIAGLASKMNSYIDTFRKYHFLWKQYRAEVLHEFQKNRQASIDEFEAKIKQFADIEQEIEDMGQYKVMGSLLLDLKPVKLALKTETSLWKQEYGKALNLRVKYQLEQLFNYMDETRNSLMRKIEDLESVNSVMMVLSNMRKEESKIEYVVKPIEDAYALLAKYQIRVTKEEHDLVDGMDYKWNQLVVLAREKMEYLRRVGPDFRRDLLKKVKLFKQDIQEFEREYHEKGPNQKGIKPRDAIKALKAFQSAFEERQRKWKTYSMGERLFGLPETQYCELSKIEKELNLLVTLYNLYSEVIVEASNFEDVSWSDINVTQMSDTLANFQTKCKKMNKNLHSYDAYIELKATIENFYNTLPLLELLHNDAVKERHWKNVSEICGKELDYKSAEFKVKNLIEAQLINHKDDIEEIVNAARKEKDIENKLRSIREEWTTKQFVLGDFKQRGKLILKDTPELIMNIEDSQVLLAGLMGNIHNTYFKQDIQTWMVKLSTTQSVIDDWLKVQALWIYMEAVFTGGDIAKELPVVAKKFADVDRHWVKIMSTAEQEPGVIKLCYGDEMLRELLPHLKENLEKCQKSLSGYLEAKRMIFPRFYFLSDNQLLEILGQGSDPTTIQEHLSSMFGNTASVDFDTKQKNTIIAIRSAEGEVVQLSEPVIAKGNIEEWLNKLVDQMCETINDVARTMSSSVLTTLEQPDKEKLNKFINSFPSQISLLGLQLLWTWDSEFAIRKAKMDKMIMQTTKKKFETLLSHLVSLTTNDDLTPLERTRIETLITIHIHQVEIFQYLTRKRVKSAGDFEWLKQTRFYWKPEKDRCIISITDVDFEYCNEFLGCNERLVITTLTDRIYISCAQAMGMFLGGAPSGPAGTGKTETTKDMGRTMGKYFITINCVGGDSIIPLGHGLGYSVKQIYDYVSSKYTPRFHQGKEIYEIEPEHNNNSLCDTNTYSYEQKSFRRFKASISRVIRSGKAIIRKLVLLDGTIIRCTPEHRLLVINNRGEKCWKTAESITSDERVVRTSVPVSKYLPPIAHLVENGSNIHRRNAQTFDKLFSIVIPIPNDKYQKISGLLSVATSDYILAGAILRLAGALMISGSITKCLETYSGFLYANCKEDAFAILQDIEIIGFRSIITYHESKQAIFSDIGNEFHLISIAIPSELCFFFIEVLKIPYMQFLNENSRIPQCLFTMENWLLREFLSGIVSSLTVRCPHSIFPDTIILFSQDQNSKPLNRIMEDIVTLFGNIGFEDMSVNSSYKSEKKKGACLTFGPRDIPKLETHVSCVYSSLNRITLLKEASFINYQNYCEKYKRRIYSEFESKNIGNHNSNGSHRNLLKLFNPELKSLCKQGQLHICHIFKSSMGVVNENFYSREEYQKIVAIETSELCQYIAVPIFSNSLEDEEDDVYDISVPGAENFECNGVVAHNCSDQMGYISMGMLFKGIAQSGVWCGFDEINRVFLDVLSVVAAQIKCVFDALRNRLKKFTFVDGKEIVLDEKCAIFITMNPGYAGRTELPENMKALFRTIAVVVPDRRTIMKVRLAASGFQENSALSRKFQVLYRLCEEQLSKQTHYDFGLRNILSVLRSCGPTLRKSSIRDESKVLLRVLKDMNISKLVDEDSALFIDLLKDLFPNVSFEDEGYEELQIAIREIVDQMGLINHKNWNLKIVQLYEQYKVRHGLCIMGPSGTGKSTCINVLAKSISKIEVPTKIKKMNPKAISANQMFGILDPATNDWNDGIFSALWRNSYTSSKKENTWIILDGPVDTNWIENLNTVLDDTKVLTLANGDRLSMPKTLKLVFEVGNLDKASPATVSRMGMVYVGISVLGWKPAFQAWANKLKTQRKNQSEIDTLSNLFESHMDNILTLVENHCEKKMSLNDSNTVHNTLRLLDGLFSNHKESQLNSQFVERLFIFAATWSVGALLEYEDKKKFNKYFVDHKLEIPPISKGSAETIYDYLVDESGNWKHWRKVVPEYSYPKTHTPIFSTILVPTMDNIRSQYLINLIAKQHLPVLLIGENGTAKTVTIQQYIEGKISQNSDTTKYRNKFMAFSSATTPQLFQNAIFVSMEKRMSNSYGPPPGNIMMVFIDDINMPDINEWGDQVTNEIVRQLIEDKGFYSLDPGRPGEWINIVDVQFFAAMNHPGGGRNDIPSRLKRHFTIFNVTFPSNDSIDIIFSTICEGHFCLERKFSEEVIEQAKVIPRMTRKLWNKTRLERLPTPSKFHYIFNLRDLSRVFQGILQATPDVIRDTNHILSLWKHECERVLQDKFNDEDDVSFFQEAIKTTIKDEFGEDIISSFSKTDYFVDFLRDPQESTSDEPEEEEDEIPKVYEPISSFEELQKRLEFYLGKYNEVYKKDPMDIVLFEFAMIHLMRISRVIRIARGNMLLIGVGGSGKQSLTKLASFIAGYKSMKLNITKTYNLTNLMDDIRLMYKSAALGKPVTFIFTDNDIKDETFLEYINMILTSGEIPSLFSKEERDMTLEELRVTAYKLGYKDDSLYKFFLDRVRDNLHIVLCFSPVGDKFRNRARKFPGLISGCTINWFPSWPINALQVTARKFLSGFEIVHKGNQKVQLEEFMCKCHQDIALLTQEYFNKYRRNTYVTPKSYLSFLKSYKSIYEEKHHEIQKQSIQVKKGLAKLADASEGVSKMKEILSEKDKNLIVAQKEADKLLEEVSKEKMIAEEKTNKVKAQADKLAVEAAEIQKEKEGAEKELESAKPALRQAVEALNSINQRDLAQVKTLPKPPPLVKRVLDGVLILRRFDMEKKMEMDEEVYQKSKQMVIKASWDYAKKMMYANFFRSLEEFDKDSLNDETCELLEPYLREKDFNKESVGKSSNSVAGLCDWVICMVKYHQLAKFVKPKIERVALEESKLNKAMKQLNDAQEELRQKQAELDVMKQELDNALKKKKDLEEDAILTKKRLESAESLISGLSTEKERWTEDSTKFEARIERLIGDVAAAAVFLSYAGPFNQEFRQKLINHICEDLITRKIPVSDDVNVIKFLVTQTIIGQWNLQGLPNDEHSSQNGIIVTKGSRYPLLIDPQGQGKEWIINKEGGELVITNFNHKNFRQDLENCIQLGKSIIIEDIDENLDPILDPVLDKNIVVRGSKKKLSMVDTELNFNDNFKLFMTSKLANPNYIPEIYAKTNIIDFTVTSTGLEDQLLALVINKEMAELEAKRKSLLAEIQQCKQVKAESEQELLERLNKSQKNLIDDSELIEVLGKAKDRAKEMKEKLSNAEITEQNITDAREAFRSVATRGSVMYFVITELSLINCMYQISLKQFISLFSEAIDTSQPDRTQKTRIKNIIDHSTYSIYKYVQRGLYEKHKIIFALLLTLKIDLKGSKITSKEFSILLKGGAALNIKQLEKQPHSWIQDHMWLNLNALTELKEFENLLRHLREYEESWRKYYDSKDIENHDPPNKINMQLFHKLLLIRSLREDKIITVCAKYIIDRLGQQFVDSIPLDLDQTWEESSSLTPIVCLLSPGSDLTTSIEKLARSKKLPIDRISMGQGQEKAAHEMIKNGALNGGFVLLQNCHLGLKYLKLLEEFLLELQSESYDKSFRVWITTEPSPHFPINLLQMSIKVTDDPPTGIKAGLLKSYSWITQEMLELVDTPEYKRLLYSTCFLHSVLIERKKFGPLGWCVPYEFNQSDLECSVQFLMKYMYETDNKKLQWSTIKYMIGDVQYGGRITDNYDKILLDTYTNKHYSNSVINNKEFCFYHGYQIPEFSKIVDYRKYIQKMPLFDPPEVFGLHSNAEITFNSNLGKFVLGTILDIQPKESATGTGETRESVVLEMVKSNLEKLPNDFNLQHVRKIIAKRGLKPLEIFLRQEIDRMQALLSLVRKTLMDLKEAIDGIIIMNSDLQDALNALYDAKVPEKWKKISWDSTAFGFWFADVQQRAQQFRDWLDHDRPKVFWISGFFNPLGFLTAVKQESTRNNPSWSLEGVSLKTEITKKEKDHVQITEDFDGVYIYGISLDGADWDRKASKLIDPPKKKLFYPLPVIHISTINSVQSGDMTRLYNCPVYSLPKRTDLTYIFDLTLKTDDDVSKWTLRGVAGLTSIH